MLEQIICGSDSQSQVCHLVSSGERHQTDGCATERIEMFNRKIPAVFLTVLAAGCVSSAATDEDAELTRQLTGLTLVSPLATLSLMEGGKIVADINQPGSSEPFEATGQWFVRDGLFCRDLSEAPEGIAEQLCVRVVIGDDTVSFDGLQPDGRLPQEFQIVARL